MMGNRTNDYANTSSSNTHPPSGVTFLEANVEEDTLDCLLDMATSFAECEDFQHSVTQGIPETIANPRDYPINTNSFQNPQLNMSYNTGNTNLQGVPVLPNWNMNWGQQCVNQGHNAGIEPSFVSLNRPQVNRDITGSSFLCHNRESVPVHTRNNASFNQSQSGIKGNFEGSFLSLGIGGAEESLSKSQLENREMFNKLTEASSNELKMARSRKVTGQTLDAGFLGIQNNFSGSNIGSNNELGFHGSLNSWRSSIPQHVLHMQQNIMQHDKNIRSVDSGHFRDEKQKEAVSTELKMVPTQKATGQTSVKSLNPGFMGFQSNSIGPSNQFSNMDRMNPTNNAVGVPGTLNNGPGPGASPHHILQMQQNAIRNIRSGELKHYPVFTGNQPVHSQTVGGNSAQGFSSQQHNLNKPPELQKPPWLASYHTPFEQLQYMRANNPNYAGHQGQVIPQNATPSQVFGSNMFCQRTVVPQISQVDGSSTNINAPFPKRLGVEFNVRNNIQTNQRHLSPVGTSLQTTSTDRGLTRVTDHVVRPSIGKKDGAPAVNLPEPFFAHGQCQIPQIQLAKGHQGTPSTNAPTVIGQTQNPELLIRQHRKRSAVLPHPTSQWVQRQKIIHHSTPKPHIPVTTAKTHPSIPIRPQTQPADHIRPVVPYASSVRPPAPAVSHITWKDPEATPKLSGYKCFLCKRDLALTSEGAVYQPAVPPPTAVLPCGHSFHDQCLQNITPDDQAKDPPCIPCAIGEQ